MSRCPAPLALDALLGYWLAELPPAGQDEVEAHLLECTDCCRRGERLAQLAERVRDLVRGGGVPLGLTPTLLARLEQDGVKIRHHRVDPGGQTRCTVGPDDDLVAVTLRGDFRAGEQVDLVYLEVPALLTGRRAGVPVDVERGELAFAEPGDVIRALPAGRARIRLHATGPAGERTIGEYTLLHTPWRDLSPEERA